MRRDARLFVSGFRDDGELDRFVKSEIRYMKGFDMQAMRCEGRLLRFDLADFPEPGAFASGLRRAYPNLDIVDCPGSEPECADLAGARVEEILYETYR